MQLVRHLELPTWDENTTQITVAYLQRQGFSDIKISPKLEIIGSRGSWIGNFLSFDMTKIIAKVRIFPLGVGIIAVEFDINTFGQYITKWNATTWKLEIIELHRLLCNLGNIDHVWKRFNRDHNMASLWWILTFSIIGKSLPETWETEIQNLENIKFTVIERRI